MHQYEYAYGMAEVSTREASVGVDKERGMKEKDRIRVKILIDGEVLGSQAGKQDEIAILNKIRDAVCGTQTYLEALFSPRLIEWFSQMVADDFCSDVMLVVDELSRAETVLRSAITSLEAEIKRMKKDHDMKISNHRDGYNGEIKKLKEGLERTKELRDEYADGLEKESRRRIEVENELRNCELISAGREEDIVRLKARLYDLTAKSE